MAAEIGVFNESVTVPLNGAPPKAIVRRDQREYQRKDFHFVPR
jgi:hypothetical protein